jgi:hypothetical protein
MHERDGCYLQIHRGQAKLALAQALELDRSRLIKVQNAQSTVMPVLPQ